MKLKRTHIALCATSLGTLFFGTAASAASVEVPEEVANLENGARNMVSSARLTMHYKSNGNTSSASGSATFIAPNVLITVGHNFLKLSKDNQSGELMGNENENVYEWSTPGGAKGTFTAKDVHFFDKVGFAKGFKNDLAVIILPNYQKSEGSYSHLTDRYNPVKEGDSLNIFGYPTGKFVPLVNQKIERTDDYGDGITGVAYHGSYPGMSGGGIFNTKGDLIGVHQNGVVGQRSGGIILSPKQLEWVKAAIDGKLNNGWSVDNGKRVYFENGKKLINTVKKVDGSFYRFGPDGDAKAIKVILKAVKTEYVADPNLDGGTQIVKRAGKGALVDDLGQEIEAGENAIIHVGTKSKVVEKILPKKNYYIVNPALKQGESYVRTKGEDGKEVITTTYTLTPDKGLIVKEDKVVNHPSDRLIEVARKDDAIGDELPLNHPLRKDLKLTNTEEPKVEAPKVPTAPVAPVQPKTEQPKVEAPKVPTAPVAPVQPKTEQPKVEAPKAPTAPIAPVQPKTEQPKVEAPKAPTAPVAPVQPKTEQPKVEAPKAPTAPVAPVQPKIEQPKVEAPKAPTAPVAPVQPKTEQPKVEAPKAPTAPVAPVQPKTELPKVEAPKAPTAPVAPVQPKTEQPKVEAPKAPTAPVAPVQPKTEQPKVEAPKAPTSPVASVQPKIEQPKVEVPKAPVVHVQPKSEQPTVEVPKAPVVPVQPKSEHPTVEAPKAPVVPVQPKSEQPTVEAPKVPTAPVSAVQPKTEQSKEEKSLPNTGDVSLLSLGILSLIGAVSSKRRRKD